MSTRLSPSTPLPHQDGRTWLSPHSCDLTLLVTRKSKPFSLSYTCSQKEKEGRRTFFLLWLQNRALKPSPPLRESAALRGTLTPACIVINVIPPPINGKSTCFTPWGRNNPHLVSPTSAGAAEGLNPPDSLPPRFPWGLLTRCSAACHRDTETPLASEGGGMGASVAKWVGLMGCQAPELSTNSTLRLSSPQNSAMRWEFLSPSNQRGHCSLEKCRDC